MSLLSLTPPGFGATASPGSVPEPSLISIAAAGLSPGQSVDPLTAPFPMDPLRCTWGTTFLYNPNRREMSYFGKAASQDGSWDLRFYDELADTWSPGNLISYSDPGHSYGNFALDPQTGRVYFNRDRENHVSWYDPVLDTDGTTSSDPLIGDAASGPPNGLTWHPNLYGVGDGGLVLANRRRVMTWRLSTDTWIEVVDTTGDTTDRTTAGSEYHAGQDAAIASGGKGSAPAYFLIEPGNPPTSRNGNTGYDSYPIPVAGVASTTAGGAIMQHPADSSRMLLLETDHVGTRRVWNSTDGQSWGAQKSYSHPFTADRVAFCSIPQYGVVWCVGYDSSTPFSIIWKPND